MHFGRACFQHSCAISSFPLLTFRTLPSMSTLHPFPALRPPRELAARVSSLPYDVMNHREAEEMASGNDASFLHICRSDMTRAKPPSMPRKPTPRPGKTWKGLSAKVTSSGMNGRLSTSTDKSCGGAYRRASSAAPPWMNMPAAPLKTRTDPQGKGT